MLGLLACPIVYRGGAEWPHAHAIVQLLYDAAHGSIDHHDDGDLASDDDAGETLPAIHEPATAPAGARLSPMGESAEGLAVALAILALWQTGRRERWPASCADALRDGERPAPELPPPRLARPFA
ncbi:MAG TPA: hypothetical protein VFX03_00205 [Thermomicrobiales bacterium]|nr:hypothetical protein [Thermomicrobiales bacterium]